MNDMLPDYNKITSAYLNDFFEITKKYEGVLPGINVTLSRFKEIAFKQLEDFRPKLMFYGVYNGGKSTLLNAVMGQELAKVADIPTTDKIESYDWNSYLLFDTPGIGAPVVHEKISSEFIDECQVVLFLISATVAFELKQIYEEMLRIIDKNKVLLIVLNDKSGLNFSDENDQMIIETIRKKIIANFHAAGCSEEIIKKYKIHIVNSADALDARLSKDKELEKFSGINDLESSMLRELRKIDAFKILTDLLDKLCVEVNAYISALGSLISGSSYDNVKNEINEINLRYNNFVSLIRDDINKNCLGMADSMFSSCRSEYSPELIEKKIRGVYGDYAKKIEKSVSNIIELAFDDFLVSLRKLYDQIILLDKDFSFDNVQPDLESMGDNYKLDFESIKSFIKNKKKDSSFCGKNKYYDEDDDEKKSFFNIFFFTKWPVPVPIPASVRIITGIINKLVNDEKGEREYRRLQKWAEQETAEREQLMQEQMSLMQNFRQHCDVMVEEYIEDLKNKFEKHAESQIKPLFNLADNICAELFKDQKNIYSDIQKLKLISASINKFRDGLVVVS
ncbi:50S ribosome-binding GTPase [Desulfobotulus alkaliphilus]|uniref:50S ribosome-binding GTPase n=1 Tax=Desulfobotulus alkaliphilus TaxID=622671 RepID=A0A562R8C0_9BACT|nr:GTPase [Desulfobotulus alkaliphilus]TWI64804.1 50S ribosome-binding GTPase [Desulfobotulus alkaliphilus]